MSICTVLDNNTQKFQDILQDNAAASRAVAWSGNNFDGNNVDTKVNKALSFINKLAKSTPQTKTQADKIIKELHDKHLVYQVKTNAGIHYGTKFPEIVGLILENKKNVIFSAYGNISDTPYSGKYNYLYSKKPVKRNESFMANFDSSAKKSLNSVGEGMLGFALMSTDGIVSSEKVNQTVDTIVEKIARRVINGENLNKQDIQDELDTYYNTFLDIRDEYQESGSQKGVDHTNSYLDNWDNLEQMVFNALKRRSGLSFKNGINSKKLDETTISDEESIKENNEDVDLDGGDKSQGNYSDNYSLTMDSKAGLSGKLKLFLSTLENGNSHYLTGESLFENFDTVYNSLNAFLAGSEPNIQDMIERLKEFQEYDWVKNLIEKLNEAKSINSNTGLPNNMTLVKQFVTAMNKHYIDMSFVQWVNEANGHTLKVMGDNANSRMRVVIADWQQKLEQSNLVTVDEFGRRTFNAQYAKDVLPAFNEIFKTGFDSTPQQIFDVLNSVGIRLSYTTIKRLLDGNYQYGKRKFDRDSKDQMFSAKDSHSPIANIYRTIRSISEIDGSVELGEDSKFDVFSNGSVKALASFEAKYSKHLYSNSHRSGLKTVFSYTNDKFIIDRMYELTRGYNTGNPDNFKLLEELSKDIFAKDSYWLSQLKLAMSDNPTPEALAFSEAFQFGYLSLNPIKKEKGEATERALSDMSTQEILAIKLGLLHNNDSKISGRRAGKLFYPTMSDKTNMITIQSLIRDGIKYENGSVDQDTVDYIYDKVISAEMNRMWEIQKQTNNYTKSTNIEGYDDGSRFFYTIPELNILKSIFKRTDNGVRILKPQDELTEDNIQEIKDEIKNSLNLMVRNQIEEFRDNKIGNVAGEKNLQYIDSTHANNVSSWYGRKLSNEELSDAVAADFAINYLIHNANIAQLFHGDYAQYFKGNITEFDKNFEMAEHTIADAYNLIKPTFDNLGKRLAADLAPGYEADFGNKQKLRVTVSKDRKMASLAIEYIDKVYRKTSQNRTAAEKAATKAWNDINTSDAQSWTTLDFHIDTLFNFGNKNITEAEYYALKKKIADTKPGEDIDFTEKEWSLVLQPTKPLYSNNCQVSLDNDNSVGVRNYIKTSSFPLIPQLVRGTELESVMRVMEKNGIDMHVFESGYKVGATDTHKIGKDIINGKLKIFNKDGSINEDNVNLLGTEGNYIDLDIRGFKIQQEVPYHDHPGEVNRGTQESKLLFSNIKHIGGFKYDGKTYTGEQLEEIYHFKYKEIYQNEAKKLKNELFKKDSSGNPTNELNIEALQKILKEEANGRGYSINDIIGLDMNEFDNTFKYPIWALPSAKQYESLIISIVDNRVRKIKLPGNSFVLGSEAGFSFKKQIQSGQKGMDTIRKYQDKIIFTSNFDLKQGSLLSYRENGDGMKPSQVFVPMKLKGSNGEFIDLMKYTFIKDGKLMLDEDRLPKDLLRLFGFRIPTQGHNSMAALEIAGFLPKECGDLIIASQDLVVQMGSDFDVDKLFTYNYLTKEINDNGVPKIVIDNNGDNKLYNDLLDIHLSVFNNNNHELYSLILAPNGFGKLKIDKSTGLSFDIEAIKQKANGLKGTTNYLSPQYQMTKFLNGTSGKMGCLGYGTKVLMFDGKFKEAQDIVIGDKLMGIDSTPRNVLQLCRGTEQMYIVKQNRGINYRVNESHILSLVHTENPIYSKPTINSKRVIDKTKVLREKSEYIVNIKLADYLNKNKDFKNTSYGYKSTGIDFEYKPVFIDPYYIGLWLGDGRTNDIKEIATVDMEIEQYLDSTYGIKCSYGPKNISKRCYPNRLNWAFKREFNTTKCGLNPGEKYIPDNYLYNSKDGRLRLLAGLIDSDGTYCKTNKQYVISSTNEKLTNQIIFLCRSLGFYTSMNSREARISKMGLREAKIYNIRFIPECDIPVLLPRKMQIEKSNFKNRLHTGIKIEKDIIDNYYGFVLDGDHLFMLEDFTVTHNTGVFSSLSMMNAISQGKGLKYVNIDENGHDSFGVVFGNVKSTGKLGELKTLDGKTYISKVIEAFQSASVDNEKEQILYKLNINKQTVSVINALAMLGFDEEVISYFINQPIIEEYVRRAAERDSSLNKFQESLGGDLFSQIADEYLNKYDGLKVDKSFKNAGVEQLKAQMEINEGIRETIPQDFWGKQLAVLEKFKELNEVGLNLQALMQTVNAESKGLGRTIFGSIDRESKIDNIDSVKEAIEAKKPVVGVLNAGRLLDNTLNGFVADYGTHNLNLLGAQIFPYKNKTLLKMFDYASKILERKGDSIAKNEEFMLEMFQAVKSYLFSNPKLFGENFDIEKERQKLFLGESELVPDERGLNKLVVKTPSLAETINAIKDMKLGQSNALLRALSVDLRQTSSDFKLVKYMASAGQNLDESDLHQAFISLFRENFPISYTINGKQFETTSNKLAKDLIKYTYLSGGIQEAIQFTRYIPIEVLDYMGFMDELKTLGNQLNDGVFNNTSDEVGNMTHSDMIEQYLQNNPSKVPTKIGAVNAGGKLSDAIKDIQYISTERDGKIISRFKANITDGDPKSPGGLLTTKKYVAGTYKTADFISGIGPVKSKYITVIYKRIGDEFILIPTLGSFGVNEYTFGQGVVAPSAIKSRNHIYEMGVEKAIESTGTKLEEEDKSVFKDLNEINILSSKNPVKDILERIAKNEGVDGYNQHHVELAKKLIQNEYILSSLSDTKFQFKTDNFSPVGRYNFILNELTANGNKSKFRDKNHLNEMLLHEIIHAYTVRTIRIIDDSYWQKQFESEYNSLPQEVLEAHKRINQLRRGLINLAKQSDSEFSNKLKLVEKYINQQSLLSKGNSLPSDETVIDGSKLSELAYGLLSNSDFVTMATTNDKFREDLENLNKQSLQKDSVLEKLWNALLEFLGLKNLSQLTKDYVTSEIFQYIETINESKTGNKESVASIPQNLVSGIESFGTKQEATDEIKSILGPNPHSIDMIEVGLRTRTTRSIGEMEKYNVKVGDVVTHYGKSKDGSIKRFKAIITAIHPKGTHGFMSTWNKEGWTSDGIKAIERYKDGAAAIEFQLINELKSQPTKIFDNEKYREVEKLMEEIEKTPSISEIQRNEITFDKYKYFGRTYEIVISNGIPVGVKDYKGKLVDMQKILDAYNTNPDIDIQNGKPFRNVEVEEVEEIKTPQKASESEYSFTYKGKTIPTEFQLTNGQIKALERLIDFVQTGKTSKINNLMTLQGYAGTGKTTIIGYLQKYFSRESTFVYMAPTHAATVELSMATSKTGNKSLAMTVASGFKEVRDFSTMTSKKVPSKKLDDRLGYFNNVLVIDEVSMLNRKDYETVKAVIASGYKDMKVIFMGDMMQIPEVDASNPKEKQVSLAFSELENIELTEVKRTEDAGILNVLTAIRKQRSDLIPTIPNTNTISYLSQNDFDKKVYFTFKENPENTVMISYINAGAKAHNKRIRQSLGRTGDLVKDDIIVGFGGYNSKQVENGDIANSIRYTVEEVKIDKNAQNAAVNIMAVSSRLEKLKSLGVGVSGIGRMKYLQLSPNDAFTFDEINRDDMDLNNQFLSKQFEKVLNAKNAALVDKRAWPVFFAAVDDLSKTMSKYNVGADYVYNPKTKKMEVYDYNSHGAIVKSNPEMKVEKGVDYGHAITIHKSQGSTVENVFFDSNTLPKGSSSTLMRGQNIVGSEKKSLIYVALSRASKNLYINKVDGNLFYDLSKGEPVGPINPDADVKFEAGEREFDLMPEFNEQLIPTENEVKLLEKMYGKDFMIGYNKLTDVEKQSILKCLK